MFKNSLIQNFQHTIGKLFICIAIVNSLNADEKILDSLKYHILRLSNDARLINIYGNTYQFSVDINKSIVSIEDKVKVMSRNSDDADRKNMLEFVLYNTNEITHIVDSSKLSLDDIREIDDLTQATLEGLGSIKKNNLSDLSIDRLNKFNIEELNSYYLNKEFYNDKAKLLLKKVDNYFGNVNEWRSYKKVFLSSDIFVPNIIFILSKKLEDRL